MSYALIIAEISQYAMAIPLVAALLLLLQAAWRKRKVDAVREEIASRQSPTEALRSAEAGPPADLIRWHVEMHDLSRELRATLDNKLVLLERLVRDAKHEADRLEQAIERARLASPREQANRV